MHFSGIIPVVTDVSFKAHAFIVQSGSAVLTGKCLVKQTSIQRTGKMKFVKYFCLL